MIVRWAQALSAFGAATDWLRGADAVLFFTVAVLFLSWVVTSEDRTRHVTKLILALRRSAPPDGRRPTEDDQA